MESKSQRQDKEIDVLKELLQEEKQFSKLLSGRISQLEASTNPNPIENDQLLTRPKRHYRLLLPHILIENNGRKNQQLYGPATNCDELRLLGYTLNGYYLVKNTTDSAKKGKIGIVYCRFQQLQGQKQITTSYMRTLVDLETSSELEGRIMDRLTHKLLPIDAKIMEQTKQIKEIFGILGKKNDFNKCCPYTQPSVEQNQQQDEEEQPSSYQQQKPQEQQRGSGLDSFSGLIQQGLNIVGSLGG